MFSEIDCGAVISFEYPAANYQGVRPRWEARKLLVERVRRLDSEPLDPVTTVLEPQLKRGKTLVTGRDLNKGQERSFYAESMRDVTFLRRERVIDVSRDVYGNDYSVVWIETDESWDPSQDLPDEFRIVSLLIDGVSASFADTITDKANQEQMLLGCQGRWAATLPPGFIIPPGR